MQDAPGQSGRKPTPEARVGDVDLVARVVNRDRQLAARFEHPRQTREGASGIGRVVQDAEAHHQVEHVVRERRREQVRLDKMNACQVAGVGLRGIHRKAVVKADVLATVAVNDFGEPPGAAPGVQHQLALELFDRKVEAGLQAVARVSAAGGAVELRFAELVPLIRKAAGIRVAGDEARDAAHDRERVRLLTREAARRDHVEIRAWIETGVADRTAQPREEAALHRGAPGTARIATSIGERKNGMQMLRRCPFALLVGLALTMTTWGAAMAADDDWPT